MTEVHDSSAHTWTRREVPHSTGGTPDAWDALTGAMGEPPPGSVVVVLSKQPELARALVLNLLAEEAYGLHHPSVLIESSQLLPRTADVLMACACGYPADDVRATLEDDGIADMIRDTFWRNLDASPWASIRDCVGWPSKLESIRTFRRLGVDVRNVVIDSLNDLHIHGAGANGIRSEEPERIRLIVQALKGVARVQRVAIVAAASTACEDQSDPFFRKPTLLLDKGHLNAADRVLVIGEPASPNEGQAGLPEGAQIVQVLIARPDTGRQQLVDIVYEPRCLRFSAMPAPSPAEGAPA